MSLDSTQGDTTTSTTTDTTATSASDLLNTGPWYGEIKDPDLKSWAEKNNPKDAESTLKQLRDAQKIIGDPNRVSLPKDGEDITQSDIWDKLKVPKEAKGYEIKRPTLPEGMTYDENFETQVKEAAAKLRVHPTQLQGLVDIYAQSQIAQFNDLQKHKADEAAALTTLLKDWGAEKDVNIELAKRGAKFLGLSTEETDALEKGLLGGPLVMKALLKFGKVAREGSTVDGDSAPIIGKEALKAELAGLNDRIGKGEKLSDAEMQKRSALYKQIHG